LVEEREKAHAFQVAAAIVDCSFVKKAWWPPFRNESFTKVPGTKITEIFGDEAMKPA